MAGTAPSLRPLALWLSGSIRGDFRAVKDDPGGKDAVPENHHHMVASILNTFSSGRVTLGARFCASCFAVEAPKPS
jgi:hypothetical protein